MIGVLSRLRDWACTWKPPASEGAGTQEFLLSLINWLTYIVSKCPRALLGLLFCKTKRLDTSSKSVPAQKFYHSFYFQTQNWPYNLIFFFQSPFGFNIDKMLNVWTSVYLCLFKNCLLFSNPVWVGLTTHPSVNQNLLNLRPRIGTLSAWFVYDQMGCNMHG